MEFLAFYEWLVEKYPLILVDAVHQEPQGSPCETHLSKEDAPDYDNLYVDMKWIMNSYFRLKDKGSIKFQEIFLWISEYIDQLFSIVRPIKLLYLAFDGVLPRSQMNLQRGRCFQIAKDFELPFEGDCLSKEFETLYQSKHSKKLDEVWDPNIIGPGTEFMASLTVAIKYYICLRINNDLGWRNIKVIFSDATVPGEGKHKIMSYIRLQRNLPGYNANTRHCLFGLNADSLMMALATHEVHFSILHETAVPYVPIKLSPSQTSYHVGVCNENTKTKDGIISNLGCKFATCNRSYQFVKLWILREYLEDDFKFPDSPFEIDFEHLVDDFVFMCFLAGGEFLPQMPILRIPGRSMNILMDIYKKEFTEMGGYLTESGEINLKRIEHFIQAVSAFEDAFIKRHEQVEGSCSKSSDFNSDAQNEVDNGELDWKERYYAENFGAHEMEDFEHLKKELVLKYTEGLCWIMRYYYQGVCSWQWYYPYYFAPLASELKDLDELEITFFLGKPFKPFEHLMGVLPLASAHVLPEQYRRLMTDLNSPISGFFSQDSDKVDKDGKDCLSLSSARLPFIEETCLLGEMRKLEGTLTESESWRNTLGSDILFLSCFHPLASHIYSLYASSYDGTGHLGLPVKEIDPVASEGLNGFVEFCDEDICPPTVPSPLEGMDPISNNHSLCVMYKPPPNHRHTARPVAGAVIPAKVVKKDRSDVSRSQASCIDILDDGILLLPPKELQGAAASDKRDILGHLNQQDLNLSLEVNVPTSPSCESVQPSAKTRKGPPGFEHVIPTSVASTAVINSISVSSPVNSSSPLRTLTQPQNLSTDGTSPVSTSVTSRSSPTKVAENAFTPSSNLEFTVNQVVASGRHSPAENSVPAYKVPHFIPNPTGSPGLPGNVSPRRNSPHSYSASKATPALQGRSISQYSTFTSSPVVSSIPSNVIASQSYSPGVEFSEFQGAHSVAQYPQSLPHHHQMYHQTMQRAPPGQQGFSGFGPRVGPQAPHIPMRPLGHSQPPGTMPHPWNVERGGLSQPPLFPHGQHFGNAQHFGNTPYMFAENRPESFSRARGLGPRHPNAAIFY